MAGYALAHEVSAAYRYGLRRTQDALDRDDLDYLRRVLPGLIIRFADRRNIDLVAELVSAMTYLELHALPAYRTGIAFLLRSQNPNGTWGDYEQYRATYGDGVDQKFYLHTTMVTLRALLEAHDGAWLRTGRGGSPWPSSSFEAPGAAPEPPDRPPRHEPRPGVGGNGAEGRSARTRP